MTPTVLGSEGGISLPRRSAYRRQQETLLAATEINGGSIDNRKPVLDGMFATILKYSHADDLSEYIAKPGRLKKSYSKLAKSHTKDYEQTEGNLSGPYHYYMLGAYW